MGISKKKKTAIILGTACAIFATSAIVTGVYSKMNKKEPIDNDQRSLKEEFHKMMW